MREMIEGKSAFVGGTPQPIHQSDLSQHSSYQQRHQVPQQGRNNWYNNHQTLLMLEISPNEYHHPDHVDLSASSSSPSSLSSSSSPILTSDNRNSNTKPCNSPNKIPNNSMVDDVTDQRFATEVMNSCQESVKKRLMEEVWQEL